MPDSTAQRVAREQEIRRSAGACADANEGLVEIDAHDFAFMMELLDESRAAYETAVADSRRIDWLSQRGSVVGVWDQFEFHPSKHGAEDRLRVLRQVIDDESRASAIREAAETIDPKTGKKVIDLMAALKASLEIEKARQSTPAPLPSPDTHTND